MMKKFLLTTLVLFCSAVTAQAADDTAKIVSSLEKIVPGVQPDSVKPSPVPGLYEVVYGMDVVYISKDGKYLIQGDLLELDTRANLTEELRTTGRREVIKTLPESGMVVFAPAKPKHTVTIFTDIDCGYCRKLHAEIASYNKAGIKVRYAAYPRAGVGSDSYNKAVAVWCSANKQEAMTKAKAGQAVEAKPCDHPIEKHMAAARALGVQGTPTIVLDDGHVVPGYVPAEHLLQTIEAGKGS